MNCQDLAHMIMGHPNDFSLEHRVFNITAVIAMFMGTIAGLANILMGLSWYLTATMFLCLAIMGILYYFSRFKGYFQVPTTVACIFIVLIFSPAAWIFNGGVFGGAHYSLLLLGMVICAICSGWKRFFFLALLIVIVALLGLFQYLHPELVYYSTDRTTFFTDMISSYLLTLMASMLLFLIYVNNYDNERKRVWQYTMLLEEMAITDGLTGVFNHSYSQRLLEERIEESLRYKKNLSIIMVDIDHFKNINDSFGHEIGNQVLVKAAAVMSATVRSTDIVGRYGGEEFLIICPETALEDAGTLAERLRTEIGNHDYASGSSITISAGVAALNLKSAADAISLIELADDALYAAKRDGRNCVKVDDPNQQSPPILPC